MSNVYLHQQMSHVQTISAHVSWLQPTNVYWHQKMSQWDSPLHSLKVPDGILGLVPCALANFWLTHATKICRTILEMAEETFKDRHNIGQNISLPPLWGERGEEARSEVKCIFEMVENHFQWVQIPDQD